MIARLAPVLSRLPTISLIAVSAITVAACNGRATGSAAAPEAAVEAPQSAPAANVEGPGHKLFQQVEALGLRAEQRDAVIEIEQNLGADLAPHRATVRRVAELLASSVEAGTLDARDAAAQEAALADALVEAKASFADAMNAVHDVLDAGQRAALVAELQAHRGHAQGAEPKGPLATLAFELGLSEAQKASIRDAVQRGADEIFPDRKVRREAKEARIAAMGEAFVSDDFNAADFDFGGGDERSLESFGEVARRAVDLSGRVLGASQRKTLSAMIRDRAARL